LTARAFIVELFFKKYYCSKNTYLFSSIQTQAGGATQAVERLSGKHEALNSNPSTEKKMGEMGIKENDGRGEFKHDIFVRAFVNATIYPHPAKQ
jgi:hypothetical protein